MKYITRKECEFPRRRKETHKGESGKLLIIGGSEEYVGAVILAGLAAYKSGVDIVTIAAPKKAAWAINAYEPSIITKKLNCKKISKKQIRTIKELIKKHDAILIGNGLGRGRQQEKFTKELLRTNKKPIVIDADAIHYTIIKEIKAKKWIITPHKKEYEVLKEKNNMSEEEIIKKCNDNKNIIIKGRHDRIISDEIMINKTGVPEMAVGGTGDVLAGLTAGFLAQGIKPKQASINAAWLCGKAGEKAKKELGNFTATEMIKYLKW